MEELTRRQREMFEFVKNFTSSHGYPPTIREIQNGFGLKSTKGVKDHIDKLVTKGYLTRSNGAARALTITSGPASHPVVSVPIVGKVAAGMPLLATENILGFYPVPARLSGSARTFLLNVSGDSMVDAAILDGDLVLVRQQPFVEQGEIAVVMVDDEATVKRFYMRNGRIELTPENPSFEVMSFGPEDSSVRVLGKVIAVFRNLE
jgi:repressor LexA